jgi:sensor histidine kinase YesM
MKLSRNIKELLLIFALATGMGYFMCRSCFSTWEYLWRMEVIMITIWLVMWYGNAYVSHLIDQHVTWLDQPVKRFTLGIIGAAVFTAVAILSLALFFKSIFDISIGNGWDTVWISIAISIVILLFMLSREFLYSWRDLSLREEKMRSEVLASKFNLLKSQVNPHFMFNSLNTLNALIYQDQELAAKYVGQLSKFYRTVLSSGKNEIVTVEDEIGLLESYIFLQSIRFADRFKVNINLSEASRNKNVPPMVLQMLLENAIKHNELTEEKPLVIDVYDEGDMLYVKNEIAIKQALPGDNSSIGLSNIRARYKIFSDTPVEITDDGKQFIVKLPLLKLS